jgi:hypothetical protein
MCHIVSAEIKILSFPTPQSLDGYHVTSYRTHARELIAAATGRSGRDVR